MARAVDPSDANDPTDESVDVETADDPEFADGFEVFDADDEAAELVDEDDATPGDSDDDGVLVADADDELTVDAVLNLDEAQFDADDPVVESGIEPDAATDDEVEGVRGSEFVCLGCYLAKRHTQLANKKRSLCIDCV